MDRRWRWTKAPHLIAGLGIALFTGAFVHHATELATLNGSLGPVAAFLLDSLPALGLVYAGYWLAGSDLSPADRWTVLGRCLVGAALFGGILALTMGIRIYEARSVPEPVFPLLVATEAGAIAGFLTGYYVARARADARRAEAVSDALAFVNDLIRHDLRNDLTVIVGRGDHLRKAVDGDAADSATVVVEKSEEAINRIETTEAVTETLVGDPRLEPTDLSTIAAEMTARIDGTHPVEFRTNLPESAPVRANSGLRSVVDNLLENAAEHNDAETPSVEVAVSVEDDVVRLSIRDNGPGIPVERRRTLLEPGLHSEGGGLSLVGTLVEGYDGTVRIEDNNPRGTVVTVDLPRAEADS